ncbi:hypothetical protein, conserved [Eimeria praecox]|uniref:Uncharacterized protein n=1 Tax=Eimeria praecox TaxID=51316 RepID=U6GYE6_9EIME|nr:hypothetical protein, conserved [Eimeria praecox]
MHSGRRSDLGARLRPSLAAESLSGPAPYPNPSGITMGSLRANTWGRVDGARESAHSLHSSSRHHRLEPSDVERPTSPAFMKLLSQRSPKAPPSEGSRSPSVMSQISGRRRVSSPAIAARAWLGSSSTSLSHAPATPVQAQGGNTGSVESGRQGTETDQDFTVLSRSRGRSDKKKNRDESTGHRGRSTSSQRHGHRKSLSKSRRETEGRRRKEGTVLSPTKHAFEELSRKGSSRPPPKKVISPRHLPPPTFEKILLGLIDDDFTSGNDEVDVFGAESKQRDEAAPFETLGEEECVSVSVEHTDCMQDEVHSSASFSPHSSRRSSLENRCGSQAQQDGVIPEHFLYIPPLRLCGNSAEEKRPVPALMHPTDDEAQVSVREDRRHIATLFSLEAAESQAQKARLQEQLKATSPFRLTEVGGSSASQSDGVEIISPPPGKSKRRERSTLLETIVREHDWESEEQTFEENIHIYPEQQEQAQNSETLKVSQWQFFTSDEEVEVESPRGKESDAEPSSPRACEQESDKGLDGPAPAAQAGNSPELPPEECGGEDVPGAFDAVWGRSASPSQGANDSQSKASSNSDNGENLRELYSANTAAHRMSRIVDFLSAASLHSEDGEAASGDAQGATAPEKDSDAASSDSGTATEGLMKTARAPAGGPATVQLDEDPGKVPLLRLGDPQEWEVRYSTDDDLPNSVEQSPFNCEEARSADSATQEDTEQRSSKDQGQTVEFEEEQDLREDTYTHASRYFEEDREASSSRFPEEPPSTACRGPAGGPLADSTRMSSYSSTRLASVGNCEQSRSGANEAPPGRRVTKELQLAAATLDTRLRSVQSITSEDAPTEAAVSRRSLAVVPHILKSASRKRQRTLEEEGAATGTAPLHPGGRADEERKVASETKYVLNSTAQAFLGVAKNCLLEQSQVGRLLCSGLLATNRVESPTKATGAAAAAAAEADDALETERPWTRMKDPRQADVVKLSEDIITVEADAWHEGSTVPAHDAEKEEDGEDTSRPGNGSLCEADFSGPFNRYSDSLSPCRTSVPATTRSIEAFEAISRAISG